MPLMPSADESDPEDVYLKCSYCGKLVPEASGLYGAGECEGCYYSAEDHGQDDEPEDEE